MYHLLLHQWKRREQIILYFLFVVMSYLMIMGYVFILINWSFAG